MRPVPNAKADDSSASASMSPDAGSSERELGRTWAHSARGALILALLGCGAVVMLVGLLTKRTSPVGELYLRTGVPASVPLAVGCACVLLIAAYSFWRAVRLAPRFRLTDRGLTVRGALGEYTLEWRNIRHIGVTPGGALGIRVVDRSEVLSTHTGSTEQREWLRTAEPYGEWDYLFHPGELGASAQQAHDWLVARRP